MHVSLITTNPDFSILSSLVLVLQNIFISHWNTIIIYLLFTNIFFLPSFLSSFFPSIHLSFPLSFLPSYPRSFLHLFLLPSFPSPFLPSFLQYNNRFLVSTLIHVRFRIPRKHVSLKWSPCGVQLLQRFSPIIALFLAYLSVMQYRTLPKRKKRMTACV